MSSELEDADSVGHLIWHAGSVRPPKLRAVVTTQRGEIPAAASWADGYVHVQGDWEDGDLITRVDIWNDDLGMCVWWQAVPVAVPAGSTLSLRLRLRPEFA